MRKRFGVGVKVGVVGDRKARKMAKGSQRTDDIGVLRSERSR